MIQKIVYCVNDQNSSISSYFASFKTIKAIKPVDFNAFLFLQDL